MARAPVPISQMTPEEQVAELQRRRVVGINEETVTDIASTDFPGHYVGEDHSWDVNKFRNSFSVDYHRNDVLEASFSLVGIDASIANAFRRILLSHIPTLAIESVFITQNTSIMQDEVLAHRLGLIPLKANPDALAVFAVMPEPTEGQPNPSTDLNTAVFKLQKTCTWNPNRSSEEDDPVKMYNNAHIYASDLVWEPVGKQVEWFGKEGIQPVNPDILLLKMRPGQEVNIEMHAVKGFGADHAKFSPVATATYRLRPTIDILQPIIGRDAVKFSECFPKGVIGLEEITEDEANAMNSKYEGMAGQQKAVVKDAFRDTVSRECLRHDEFKNKVKLGRVRDHFIFNIESTGQIASDELFLRSVLIMKMTCQDLREMIPDA